ncbi:Folylpolyglutamate synthase [Sphingobacterium spiritivorum]|uniref:Dihydrofolate synthase/folylpolyglutamate synthase n=1 Tax=Sphingobacterium spiritivorum TaxID=258 RepID=A0A380B9T1_SPHSI|nr:folylpolyglutamate synthase/dihydrofolate synthase family protein [Sphingobacterium spiritivorum]SUI96958.1 Folylpolyglutamate synthase [Sphingobacterium spiritivorum]
MKAYKEVIEYLYTRLPMFTREGVSAYKKDLDNTITLCQALGNPQDKFKSIHIAGTNGKGSSSHMLASVLASAGYKTGLYTSPHLVDFRERIRVNGEVIPEQDVIEFVETQQSLIEKVQPSFFEVTVAMAFDYFAKAQVDVAIIEVGLGGRLDSTNIIRPELCLITNIGMDHMNLLGNTLQEIAGEKAGIIKANTPVVISERDPRTAQVFEEIAETKQAPIRFASDTMEAMITSRHLSGMQVSVTDKITSLTEQYDLDLTGSYQLKNVVGVLAVVDELKQRNFSIPSDRLREGLSHVQQYTGLQGRWQTISTDPLIICDTGHNEDGIREVLKNLQLTPYKVLHIVMGAMKDKDLDHILPLLPKEAIYYFSSPDMPRAMPAEELSAAALTYGLQGKPYSSVMQALTAAKQAYQAGDLIFIGGSNFVVAEVLTALENKP